jgi:hypothetical protein
MYSSKITPRTNLNCGILTAAIILSHSTVNCSHEVFFNYEPHAASSHRELTRKRASVSPKNPWSDMRETLLPTVLQLLRHCWNAWRCCWRLHVTPPHSCVIQAFTAVAWHRTRGGDAWLVTAPQSSVSRKHRFVYCCVIEERFFDVTVLIWRKYATIYVRKRSSCVLCCHNLNFGLSGEYLSG